MRIFITPILEGFTFTSFIIKEEFFESNVVTIKNALLVISEGIKFISTLYLAVYSYLKRTIITTYIYMGISLFSILLNYIFVPIFGNIGSATISIIVSIAMIFTTLILNKKYEFK